MEDNMSSNVLDDLKYVKKGDLEALNRILISKKLGEADIKNSFSIATSIRKCDGLSWYWEELLKKFSDFCLNEKIINKSGFSKLLGDINDEFQYAINSLGEKNYSDIELLGRKLFTIISVGTNNCNLKDEDYFNLLNKILTSNLYWENYDFIRVLFENEKMKQNPIKRNVAFDVALNKKIDVMTMNCNLYPNVWSVLTNSDLLSMDNDTYKKSVEIAVVNIWSYVLDVAMRQDNLTSLKKKIVIDYYSEILEDYLQKYKFVSIDVLQKHSQDLIFSVVYSDRLASMDDKTYAKTLEEIKECNKPLSYTKVLVNDDINEEQRSIALDMIKEGEVRKHKYSDDYPTSDYKLPVALAAISPVLTTFSIDEYRKLLSLVDFYCQKAEDIYFEEGDLNKSSLYLNYGQTIVNFLNSPILFGQNVPRLLMVIDEITSSQNKFLIGEITSFCSNLNSAYYNDFEYKKIIELIKSNDQNLYDLVPLFTNNNVPFMDDKAQLFMLISDDSDVIKDQIKDLNKQGSYNMKMYHIFDGVDDKIVREINDGIDIKVKRR